MLSGVRWSADGSKVAAIRVGDRGPIALYDFATPHGDDPFWGTAVPLT